MNEESGLPECAECRTELGASLDDALDDSACRRLEAHLAGCEACRAELALLRLVRLAAREPTAEPPSAALRQRILERVRAESDAETRVTEWVKWSRERRNGHWSERRIMRLGPPRVKAESKKIATPTGSGGQSRQAASAHRGVFAIERHRDDRGRGCIITHVIHR